MTSSATSLAKLVSVTKDATEALELQRIAMDLARLRGMDLATASDLIGKVYGGNVGILSRYGIQLEKGTTATEALAEIQRRAAGQAAAYADTTQGKLVRAQIRPKTPWKSSATPSSRSSATSPTWPPTLSPLSATP